ncbi:hypothetical protein ACHAXT_004151 [Thalassiosira profunda]
MAAKQGLTAQIHQYSEDTKRSLLSRAPAGIKSHSWLSNLNTTCTIKSAPPRTPEVMSMLGTKCGWLAKRNEQHVWQKRWCCVVPHTFLYYFEASPMEVKPDDEDGSNIHTHEAWSGGGINLNVFMNIDQEALNSAVKDGYDEAGAPPSGRMSLYASIPNIMGGGGGNAGDGAGPEDLLAPDLDTSAENINALSPTAGGADAAKGGAYQFTSSSNLQPVGIIDLECYSAVNRSTINPTVLELAGDAVTNPDLRSFYFQSPNVEDAESWTKALLSDRHQSLKDETEAYRQVCESFPLQLANCSQMIDAAEAKAEAMEREAYSVRSTSEEGRRKVVAAVREMLERRCWETEASRKMNGKSGLDSPFGGGKQGGLEFEETKVGPNGEKSGGVLDSALDAHFEKLETNRTAFLRELEAALSSPSAVATSNVVPPVQTLVDYTSAIAGSFSDLRTQLQKHEADLSNTVQQDQTQLEALKDTVEGRNAQLAEAEKKHTAIASDLRAELEAARNQAEELAKQLEAQRMEFGMYQSATKTKLTELSQHKKILKKEVIELRKKIDENGSETTAIAHKYEKMKSSAQSVKTKNETLERYIERLENQVGVQQNMMEMMSQGGGASIVGKVIGPGATANDAKDVVSLSGMSMGSQHRRLNGTTPTKDYGAEARSMSYASQRPRTLLPPEHTPEPSKSRNISDVSPLPTPTFQEGQAKKGRNFSDAADDKYECEDDGRDPSTAYHQSETTTEAGSSPGVESDNADVAVAPLSQPVDDKANNLESESDRDMILATRSGNSDVAAISPRSLDERSERSLKAEPSKTPVQSNSFVDEVARDIAVEQEVKEMPSLDSGAERMLDVNASKSQSIGESPVVALNDSLLSGAAKLAADSPDLDDDDDDDDDNVSRVSDITEDRTQRQIDDDLAERRKILLAYVKKAHGGSSSVSLSNASAQRRLETIENMLPSIESQDASVNRSGESSRTGRLSVAQRARLDADNKSNSHRSVSPHPRERGDASVGSGKRISGNSSTEGSRTVGRSGSAFLKNLGKAIEKAVDNSVLGIGPTDDDDDDYDYGTESEIMSSVVESEASTTLQERIALQRERQVAFLKSKGMLDDEKSLRGGAGASTPSPSKTAPRRSLSGRSSTGSSRAWSPRVGVAQDEV